MKYSRHFEQCGNVSCKFTTLMIEVFQENFEATPVKFLTVLGISCVVLPLKGIYLLYCYCRKVDIVPFEIMMESLENPTCMLYRLFGIVTGRGAIMQIVLKNAG